LAFTTPASPGRSRWQLLPSSAFAPLNDGDVGAVHIAGKGVGPQDGFSEYVFFNGAGTDPLSARPRWGDYNAAVTTGGNLWFASEWIVQRCTSPSTWPTRPTAGPWGARQTVHSRLGT
jgi:hypothetical protein